MCKLEQTSHRLNSHNQRRKEKRVVVNYSLGFVTVREQANNSQLFYRKSNIFLTDSKLLIQIFVH